MMEVAVGHHSVLLTRCEGKYSAIGNQCTHYGGPLSKGKNGWTHFHSLYLHFCQRHKVYSPWFTHKHCILYFLFHFICSLYLIISSNKNNEVHGNATFGHVLQFPLYTLCVCVFRGYYRTHSALPVARRLFQQPNRRS